MSPHRIEDDCSGWTQQQGGHDDSGGQDDEDNDADIQDVLGKFNFHRGLADGIRVGSIWWSGTAAGPPLDSLSSSEHNILQRPLQGYCSRTLRLAIHAVKGHRDPFFVSLLSVLKRVRQQMVLPYIIGHGSSLKPCGPCCSRVAAG